MDMSPENFHHNILYALYKVVVVVFNVHFHSFTFSSIYLVQYFKLKFLLSPLEIHHYHMKRHTYTHTYTQKFTFMFDLLVPPIG